MTITLSNKSAGKKKRIRKSKGAWHSDEHKIFGGRVKIFRTKQSGDVWQMRVWFRENQKYFRKSLRTEDIDEAKLAAEEIYLDLRAKVKHGEVIFDRTTQELVDDYLQHKKKDIGDITEARWVTIRSQLKHYLGFVGINVKINTVSAHRFEDYHDYRRSVSPTVRQVTLINEASTIKNMYKYALDRSIVQADKIPVFPRINKQKATEKINRDALTREEWKKIYTHMRYWHKKPKNAKEAEAKQFIRYFSLLLANTGIRFGEARRLRWENIRVLPSDSLEKQEDVRIQIIAGKTGNRTVIGRRGDVFTKIRSISKHKKPTDFIFVDNETGKQLGRDIYYKHWKFMLKETGLNESSKQIVYYALRHTYATWRLYAGVDVFTLSRNMGCSVKFIEDHYGHVNVEKQRHMLTKDVSADMKIFID